MVKNYIFIGYLFNIIFLSIEASMLEYLYFIDKIENNQKKKIKYIIIDFLHNIVIFINYGLPFLILYSMIYFDKNDILKLIIILNLTWLVVYLLYYKYNDCICQLMTEKIIPDSKNYQYIDPIHKLTYYSNPKKYFKIKQEKKKYNYKFIRNINLFILIILNILYLFLYLNS